MADRIKGITIEISGDTSKLSKALEGVNKDLKTAQNGLKDVDKLLKLDPGNVDLLRQKQGYLNDAIEASKEKLAKEKEALEQLKNSDGFDKNSEQAKALQRQISDDEQQLKSLEDESKNFGSVGAQQFKIVGDKVKEVGDKISDVGKSMSTKITAPIVGIGGASIAAFKEVDAGMDIIVAKTGASGDALAEMEKSVENIATTIPTSFETAGTAIGEVNTRFGVTGQELEDLSAKFVKFAELNGTDVSTSIDNVQSVMQAFGMETEDAADCLDILNKAGQDTGVNVDKLTQDMMNNSTALQEMGFMFNSSAGFLANLSKNGIDTSAVVGGLRKAFVNATNDGKTMDEALAELQETMQNADSDTEAYAAAMELFGNKAGPQMAAAIQEGRISFEALTNVIGDWEGSVDTTFENTLDPIDDWTTAMNAAKIAGSDLGETVQTVLAPFITKLTEVITTITERFRALTPEQQEMIVKIAGIVAAIGPALIIGGKLISIVGTIITVLGTVVGVLGGPLTIAIGAIIAVGVALYKNWDKIKETAGKLASSVKEKFDDIKKNITDKIESAKDKVHDAIEKIKGFFDFKWELPKLKLPHFTMTGEFSLMPPSVPHISVDWYKKAYQNPVLFTQPTVLQTPGGLKGFGDGAGAEVVMGLNKLKEMVGGDNININVYGAQGQDVKALAAEVERALVRAQKSRSAVFA